MVAWYLFPFVWIEEVFKNHKLSYFENHALSTFFCCIFAAVAIFFLYVSVNFCNRTIFLFQRRYKFIRYLRLFLLHPLQVLFGATLIFLLSAGLLFVSASGFTHFLITTLAMCWIWIFSLIHSFRVEELKLQHLDDDDIKKWKQLQELKPHRAGELISNMEPEDDQLIELEDLDENFGKRASSSSSQESIKEIIEFYFSNLLLKRVKTYPSRVIAGLKSKLRIASFAIIMFTLAFISLFLNLLVYNICISYYPHSLSSYLTRQWFGQNSVCTYNQICYSYLTVSEDLRTSIVVNFQVYTGSLANSAYVLVSTDSQLTNAQNWDAKCFLLSESLEEERYQCYANVSPLQPDTTYFVKAYYDDKESQDVMKFKTAPMDPTKIVTFASFGDSSFDRDTTTIEELVDGFHMSYTDPLFTIVSGDIAYCNGLLNCYRRWDTWFTYYNRLFTTKQGYTLPIISAVGNHEGGGFMKDISYDALYWKLFKHTSSSEQSLELNHYHIISTDTLIIVLDSWVHLSPQSQVDWLANTLNKFSHIRNKFATLHFGLYPSKLITEGTADDTIHKQLVHFFEPLFNQHNVSIVYEHHFHLFKYSFPIKQGKIVDKMTPGATLYLGDGSFGVENSAIPSNIEEIKTKFLLKEVKSITHMWITQVKQYSVNIQALGFDTTTHKAVFLLPQDEEIIISK